MCTGRPDGSLQASVVRSSCVPIDQTRGALQPLEYCPTSLPDAVILFEKAQGSIDQAHYVIHEGKGITPSSFGLFAGCCQGSNNISTKLCRHADFLLEGIGTFDNAFPGTNFKRPHEDRAGSPGSINLTLLINYDHALTHP